MAFKTFEVTGATKEEALAKAAEYFNIKGEATQSRKNWEKKQDQAITTALEKSWMQDYLKKNINDLPGVGFYITLAPAITDTRLRPYKINNVKNEDGKRKYKTIYQLIDASNGNVLAQVEGTKSKAEDMAKKLIVDGFHGKMVCKYTKQVVGGQPVAFTAEYAPSVRAKQGVYKVFGNTKED